MYQTYFMFQVGNVIHRIRSMDDIEKLYNAENKKSDVNIAKLSGDILIASMIPLADIEDSDYAEIDYLMNIGEVTKACEYLTELNGFPKENHKYMAAAYFQIQRLFNLEYHPLMR